MSTFDVLSNNKASETIDFSIDVIKGYASHFERVQIEKHDLMILFSGVYGGNFTQSLKGIAYPIEVSASATLTGGRKEDNLMEDLGGNCVFDVDFVEKSNAGWLLVVRLRCHSMLRSHRGRDHPVHLFGRADTVALLPQRTVP